MSKTEKEKAKIKKLLERSGKEDVEIRVLKTEYRVARKDDGSLPKIEGYAAVFDKDSEDMGFIERIAPGAFKKAIKISDARALFNHDPNIILGRQSSGTLKLKEDKTGLWMEIDPPDTQLVRDMVLTPVERRDITQQSFGFTIESDEWKGLDSNHPVRTITKVRELYDTSLVTYPAYQDTTVALRSLKTAKEIVDNGLIIDGDNEDEKILITFKDEIFDFTGESRFDDAAEKIKSLRSKSSPMTTDSDITDPDPTIITDSDDKDDTLEKIQKLTARFNK